MWARRDVLPREGSYASSIIECEGASTGLGKMLCSGLGFDIQHDGLLFACRKHCFQFVTADHDFAPPGKSTRTLRKFFDCQMALTPII